MSSHDLKRDIEEVDDMCQDYSEDVLREVGDIDYDIEQAWEKLDPILVEKGGLEEVGRISKMGGYECIMRQEAQMDIEEKIVKVKWVRIYIGTYIEVRCRFPAQSRIGNDS